MTEMGTTRTQGDVPIQVVGIYLSFSLLIPCVMLLMAGLWPIYYRYEPFDLFSGIVCLGAVGIACLFRHLEWANEPQVVIKPRHVFGISSQRIRIGFLIAAVGLSIVNVFEGSASFRYSEVSLSEQGSFSLYFYTIIPATVKLLLIYHAFIHQGNDKRDKLERGLVTLALVLSINGNATAFVAVFSFLVLQLRAHQFLFRSQLNAALLLKMAGMVFVMLLFLFVAYAVGESIKRGETILNVFDWLTGTSQQSVWSPDILIERTAPSYASLVNALPLTFDWDRPSLANLIGVLNNVLFRLDTLGLTDFGVDRSNAISMMRFNYEWIDIFAQNAREGTSPGLIPGFIFCFPPILNVVALGAYVFLILGMIQRVYLAMRGELSWIGKLIFTYLSLPLFETPIDILMIIDDGFFFFVGIWMLGLMIRPTRHPSSPVISPNAAAPYPTSIMP